MRSWVIGRGVSTPSSSRAIEFASQTPIQMGRKAVLSEFSRMTTGLLDAGSMTRPRTVMRTGGDVLGVLLIDPMCRSLRPLSSCTDDRESAIARSSLADQRVGTRAGDKNIDDIADSFTPAFGKIYDAVVFAPPLPMVGIASTVAVDQDRKVATYEFLVQFRRNLLREREKPMKPIHFRGFFNLVFVSRRWSMRTR